MENDTAELIIYYITFFAIGLIFLITLITVINYTLYSVYSINALRREYTYNNSPFFKLDQIYNYMLIKYVYLLDKKRHIRFNKTDEYFTDATGSTTVPDREPVKEEDANNDFKDVVYYYDYSYIEKQIEDAIANNKPDNYIYIKSPIKDKEPNVYCKYEKINEDLGFFDNLFKFLWELRYIYALHDENTTNLYVHLNNRFYEMVLLVLFIILLIFIIKIIYTFVGNLLSTIKDDEINEIDSINIFRYVYNKKFSTIIIIIVILLYCMLHSILYKKLFIDNVYDRIHGMYKEITKTDLQMQGEVNMLIDGSLINTESKKALSAARKELDNAKAEVLAATGADTKKANEALQLAEPGVAAEVATPGSGNYNNTIGNLLKLSHIGNLEKRDTIIDFADPVNDSKAQLELFTKKMLVVNKKFNISNYDKLFNLKEYINTCLNAHKTSITCGAEYSVHGAAAFAADKNNEDRILASQLFIIIIYIYFVSNNKDDPYILIKLNKLILGQIVKVGDKDIDKDIEYTITLRSLLYEKLDHEQTRNQLNNINSIINNYIFKNCKDRDGKEINKYEHVKVLIEDKIKLFTGNIKNANENLNFFTPVYFFNLYLALEMGLNFVVILIILFSMLTYDENTPELKANIEEGVEWIKFAKEEIVTAIYGVI